MKRAYTRYALGVKVAERASPPGGWNLKRAYARYALGVKVAERVGFEPTIPFGIPAFQASALGQTAQPLRMRRIIPENCPDI